MIKLFFLILFVVNSAFASLNDKIERMLVLSGQDSSLTREKLMETTNSQLDIIAEKQNLGPKEIKSIKDRTNKMYKDIDIDRVRERIFSFYSKNYSEGEIDALIAFYGSHVGQKQIKLQPLFLEEVTSVMAEETNKLMKKK